MTPQVSVKLLFAYQGEYLRSVRDFHDLRGAKLRPTDLTCPQCAKPVTVKLSPARQIADHFAHYPDSDCPLREGGESAKHLNAKAGLSLWLSKYHKMALSFKCQLCQNWDTFLKISDYDQVIPELTLGKRRPDISVLCSGEAVGAAEVKHTHGVTAAKQYDLDQLGLRWFEIPADGANKRYYNTHAIDGEWFTIDARSAGVTYPSVPAYCAACTEYQRRKAAQQVESKLFQADLDRVQKEVRPAQWLQWSKEQQAQAVAELREREARSKEELNAWEQRDGKPSLTESGELRMPRFCEYQYRHWSGGQSIWQTLAELSAPMASWKLYGYREPGILTPSHADYCKGTPQQSKDFWYCVECGRYTGATNQAGNYAT